MEKLHEDFRPFVTAYAYETTKGELVFITLYDEIRISGEKRIIQEVLSLCNGQRTAKEIYELVNEISFEEFSGILEFLKGYDLVVDSREIYKLFHKNSSYPLIVSHDLGPEEIRALTSSRALGAQENVINKDSVSTDYLNLLQKRKSTRVFEGASIKKRDLLGIMRAMYDIHIGKSAPVPSAGMLYPFSVYLIILQSIEDIAPGMYEYSPYTRELLWLSSEISDTAAAFLLDSSNITINASVVVFLVADLEITASKYANRGYRYALIEAGHIAQNAYLFAAENHLGIVEYGGFNDEEVARALRLNYPSVAPVTSLVIGIPEKNEVASLFVEKYVDDEWLLRKELIGDKKPVKWINFQTYSIDSYTLPLYVAWARYKSPNSSTRLHKFNNGFGMGKSLAEATVKALSEAYERYASGCIRQDMEIDRDEVTTINILDINRAAPLRDFYCQRSGIGKVEDAEKITLIRGKRYITGEEFFTSIDQVFYPLSSKYLGRLPTYQANSNGIASHFNYENAIENALTELIERDAFAVTWYSKRIPPKIPVECAPSQITYRVKSLGERGREVVFLNLTLDSLPVILCAIKGDQYPYLVTGLASGISFEIAIEKAFNEAEFMYHSWRKTRKKEIRMEEVYSNLDHGIYYFHQAAQAEVSWLFSGSTVPVEKELLYSVNDVLSTLNPGIIDLTPPIATSLKVVKVISEVLMPITFGYGGEHYKHPRLNMLKYKWAWKYPAPPHCLA